VAGGDDEGRKREIGRAIRRFSKTACTPRMVEEKREDDERFGRLEETARSMGEGTVISGYGQMLTWSSSQTAWDHHGTAPDTHVHTRAPITNLGSTQAHDHHPTLTGAMWYLHTQTTQAWRHHFALPMDMLSQHLRARPVNTGRFVYCASGRLQDTSVDHVMRPQATVDAVGKASSNHR
jgi:hypothetical protein